MANPKPPIVSPGDRVFCCRAEEPVVVRGHIMTAFGRWPTCNQRSGAIDRLIITPDLRNWLIITNTHLAAKKLRVHQSTISHIRKDCGIANDARTRHDWTPERLKLLRTSPRALVDQGMPRSTVYCTRFRRGFANATR